jgi:hypothetical protein
MRVIFAAAFVVAGPVAVGADVDALHKRFLDLRVSNRPAAIALLDVEACNRHSAKAIAARSDYVPSVLRPIEAEAKEASEQCASEWSTLVKALPASEAKVIKAIVLKLNERTIVRLRREQTERTYCAGAGFKACRWKAIPE